MNIYTGFVALWLVALIVIVVVLPPKQHIDITGMHSSKCDDIIRMKNTYTGKYDLVCEINLQAEDDNIIILKEN